MEQFTLEPIGYYHGPLKEKFGLPRQARLVASLPGEVRLTEAFKDMTACRGLENFSHVWLVWSFSEVPEGRTQHTVRPPRLKGNQRLGVFATRSPFRPNRLGLSCVRLERIGPGAVLYVSGADLLDGTPIFDIKPYIPYADALPDARADFAAEAPETLETVWPPEVRSLLSPEDIRVLSGILGQDPRPAYQDAPERVYGLRYKDFNVKFRLADKVYVLAVEPL